MKTKVFVLVENNDVKCYHNLKQLCDNNKHIPYYTVYRGLLKAKSFSINSSLIGIDTITYNTKRKLPKNNIKDW